MTINTRWFTTDNKLGADLNSPITISSTSNPDYPAPPFELGEQCQGNDESKWVYVQASATVAAFSVVAIDRNFQARVITSALAVSNQYAIGIAEFQATLGGNAQIAAPGDYFWALKRANSGVGALFVGSAAVGVALYISNANPGMLTATAVTGRMNNIAVVVANIVSVTGTPTELMFINEIQYSQNFTSSA